MQDHTVLIPEMAHLRRYARALTRDADAADDLVQSCLERAIAKFHLWKPDRRLRPWLFAIMHNIYVDTVRHGVKAGTRVSIDHVAAQPSLSSGPEEHLVVKSVLSAMDGLPQEQRDALILVGIDELTYAEAAQVLCVPVGTLMSRLHRGREKLRLVVGMTQKQPAIRQVK